MVVEFDILEGWHEGISEISNEWKYLRKIPYVTIDTEKLPNIEDLKLDFSTSSYRDDSLRIQLAELETLHNVLPRLEFLTIDHFYIGGPLPMHVKPHDRVRHLSISPEDGHMWDRYFSRKYTRLETLVFNDECYCSEDVKAGALTLARSCRHLKQFSAPAPSGNSSGLYKDVLEVLGQVGAPISCLVINKWDVLTYATIVQGLCRTITKIDYTMGERCIQEDMLKPLEACVRLEELMLLANDQVFELDSILDHCKNLKALKLSGRKICISENQRTGEGYGLRKLHMFAQVISDNVYPFVSHHCPHLSSIFDMEYEKRDVVGN
ncbi:hypothetical protein DFQ28_009055 [Apophysomyces sp. BC1034]|nr:hypothetical protein DFQ28_009055 [Apophysomyces sp. BC1034]